MSIAEEAVAAGLADSIDDPQPEPEHVTPEVVDVDTSGDRDDDGIAVDAEVMPLPVRLEPSEAMSTGMSLVPVRDELKGLTELAVTLAIAENTPKDLKGRPAAVLAVFLTGRELGIPPMTALRNLHVIDGKVTVNPKVRAAMVRREGLGKLWPHQGPREVACPGVGRDDHNEDCTMCAGSDRVIRLCECGSDNGDNNADVCTWHAKRADDPNVIYSATYTLAMATNAKLTNKDNWKNYPDRMLSWRALGYLLDDAFPEIGTGLYSPDELGAITDEEGEPIIDVNSTEVLTEKASRERQERSGQAPPGRPPADPPAAPDTIATFQARIAKIKRYEGADIVLGNLWLGHREKGEPAEHLPKVENLLYRQCKLAAAILDMVEKRINAGEFGEEIEDAVLVEDQADDTSGSSTSDEEPTGAQEPQDDPGQVPPAETVDGPEAATEAPEPAEQDQPDEAPPVELPFDPEGLPGEYGTAPDLAWAERAPSGLIEEVAAGVADLKADELLGVMKLLDMSANGLSETTKRERIAARRIRMRMERLLAP